MRQVNGVKLADILFSLLCVCAHPVQSLTVCVPRGVATGWTGVDMSTPLLPEVVSETDANPASFN